MIVIAPASLGAQSTARALLHSDGGTWLDGNPAPESSAIFPDSVIQTQKEHTALLTAEGTSVTVQPETVVQFEADELVLDHGELHLNTSRAMRVRVGCITIIPILADRTQYDVIDRDGKVKVIAYKLDVKIRHRGAATQKTRESQSSEFIVREGHQATREEKCGAAVTPREIVDARGAILNSLPARIAGATVIGAILCVAFCGTQTPISAAAP